MTDTEQKRIKAICKVAHIDDIGDLSDGYHTFRQLYYQRMMLFAALVKQNRDKAWKSLRHEDGELCFGGGWFIVGIDTPKGSYTYHYEDIYFSLFDCEELERGKTWDGHTEKDVTRLLSLEHEPSGDAIDRKLVCAFISGLISDDGEREKGLEYIRNMPPVNPQPCDDAIDRAEAIKIASGYCHPANVAKELAKLPSVNPTKTGWIPVSERLPEEDGLYLVYTEEQPFVCSFKDGEFFIDEVLEWMPLPKRYESQERSDKE